MRDLAGLLGDIAGGRVLDVATQEGGFVRILAENLKDYTDIVGIDINERSVETAKVVTRQGNVWFSVMDAEDLGFVDESFDTVTISASLHHLNRIDRVLGAMKRVLKPGGVFVLVEMHRDAQTEAELSSVLLHQWVADVDSGLGRLHNRTLARRELVGHVAGLGLRKTELHDCFDRDSPLMDAARIKQLEDLIERVIQRAQGVDGYAGYKKRGEDLRKRLHQVGAQREPVLAIFGEK